MNISNLILKFNSRETENAFLEDYYEKSLNRSRFTMFAGIFIYAAIGLVEAIVYPESRGKLWSVRYTIVLLAVPLYLLSFSFRFKKYTQAFFTAIMIMGGLGIIIMIAITPQPANYLSYPAGLFLLIMFCYTFLPTRFIHATLVTWPLFILYCITASLINTPAFAFISNVTILLSANLIGMFSCYHYELFLRKDFLRRQLIQELEEKRHTVEKEKIMKDLHDGIGGLANINLLAEMLLGSAAFPEYINKSLLTISELSTEIISEIKRFLQILDPEETTWDVLVSELRHFGGTMLGGHNLSFEMEVSADYNIEQPNILMFLNIFRIHKEAITNIIKHSGANSVKERISVSPDKFILSIQDDGRGIKEEKGKGRGIANMTARATEIGGARALTSENGVCLRLEIPLSLRYPVSGIETKKSGR